MDEKNDRTPKPGPAPSRPFLRPAKGRENALPAQDPKRRLNVPPFQVPPGSRPRRAAATIATPATPSVPISPSMPTAPTPVRSKTPIIVPALVMPTFPENEPPPAVIVPDESESIAELGDLDAPTAREQRTSDERFDIVVGESLLEITGEYEKVGWDTLNAREKSEVEHPMDWSSRGQESGNEPSVPDEKEDLLITSEGGLDWDSWEFGRDTSDFAAQGEGFVINRHELSPEASEMGASHGAFDGADPEARAEPHVPDAPDVEDVDESVTGEVPDVEFTTVAETVAREEEPQPPVLSLPSISEFQMTERDEPSAEQLEALKEVEPWAMPTVAEEGSTTESSAPDEVATVLERIARRLRRGEISLPTGAATGNDELALAAALAAILRTPEQ